jgi:hypothetical protein
MIGKGIRNISNCRVVEEHPTESDRFFKLQPKVPGTHHYTKKGHIVSGSFRTIADKKVEGKAV